MDEVEIGRGVLQGGWGYVWTVYGATWLVLLGYMLSLWVRTRAAAGRGADAPPTRGQP